MKLDYRFRDPELLTRALTHPSWAAEHPGTAHNQTLEFLGDAVLELVVTERLVARFPTWSDGDLTKTRAFLVCEEALAGLAAEMQLGPDLRVGRGAREQGHAARPAVLADAVEAVLGAVFTDGGYDAARSVVLALVEPRIAGIRHPPLDPISTLNQRVQARFRVEPDYEIDGGRGPAHERTFSAWVTVDGQRFGPREGRSKAAAQREVAELALADRVLFPEGAW